MAIVNTRRKYVFVHIPKNAGTTIVESLLELPETSRLSDPLEHHNKAPYFSARADLDGFTFVSIIRNPWDRALSQYLYVVRDTASKLNTHKWALPIHSRLTREGFRAAWMPGGFFSEQRSAPDIQFAANLGPKQMWEWGDTQASWLNQRSVYFRIEDELQKACNYMGIPVPHQKNVTKHGHYRSYYDDELRNRIAVLFADDIKLGNYRF